MILCEYKMRLSKTTAHKAWMSLFWEEKSLLKKSLSFTPSLAIAETDNLMFLDFTLPQIHFFHITGETADNLLPERQLYG